ncbi:hypothetical protein H0E84_16940 [Luteimonas sp. SJ-92]|uniref:Uncharacterized protein n=1 Tax=Luteimonas salinisoli TaxID=2752307 RepID=A0A853JHN4_9GAMM|nr:hypothetical protein [Luteimonas salinisoli]NZA28067.1 hypothetical protein [Luteimonas salinisoli]
MTPEKNPDKSTPAGRDDDKSGYAERLPRDRDDARNVGKPPKTDPDAGGLERDPEDDADPAEDD